MAAKNSFEHSFNKHDHSQCVDQVMDAADSYCAANGLRFTPVRRKVLELLLEEHRALGAYKIMELLGDAGFGTQPPVAYRALDFLVEHGFAHKIERLNAFVACVHPGEKYSPIFMICRSCQSVAEVHASLESGILGEAARANNFLIDKVTIEAEGICPSCKDRAE
jgi:Fur family zinc uptake transcriptional regulator